MVKLHVEVTQDDIAFGCVADSDGSDAGGCMVYRAFQRATEGAFGTVRVVYSGIELGADRRYLPFRDRTIGRRIRRFDAAVKVKPFAFDLELPDALFAVPS